jgi:hypothetical protein
VDHVDAADAGHGVFDRLDDLGLDLTRTRAPVDLGDDHHREGDVGIEVGAQSLEPEDPEDQQQQREHAGEDRTADGDIAE